MLWVKIILDSENNVEWRTIGGGPDVRRFLVWLGGLLRWQSLYQVVVATRIVAYVLRCKSYRCFDSITCEFLSGSNFLHPAGCSKVIYVQ